MTEGFNPYSDPMGADPADAPRPKRGVGRLPKAALTGGIVAGLALGGTGVGLAVASATSSTSTAASSSTSTTAPAHPSYSGHFGGRGFGSMGGLGFGGIGGGVVHGVFTVKSGTGYKTEEVQTGTVTAVSSSSITVSSADGYSHSYSVVSATVVDAQAGGIASVAAKDQVTLTATVAGSGDTANNITDLTKLKSSRTSFGFGPPGGGPSGSGWGGPAPTGAPSSAPSASGTAA